VQESFSKRDRVFRFAHPERPRLTLRMRFVAIAVRNLARYWLTQFVNLNLIMYQMAATPSFHVIFFPSE